MNKEYYIAYIDSIKYLYKYNKATKDCAKYFLNKYYKKKAQNSNKNITVEEL